MSAQESEAGPCLADAHVHLGFMANRLQVAAGAADRGMLLAAASVTPQDYQACQAKLFEAPNVICMLGLHPWWIADGRAGKEELTVFRRFAPDATAFGEIGLDFSKKRICQQGSEHQLDAFQEICKLAVQTAKAQQRRIPMSIHSIRAATQCLDILEQTGALVCCSPIFHWFSGSTPEMTRAVKAGCWFSVNEYGLKTGKGREYVKLIPQDRLLLETDLPSGQGETCSADKIVASLERASEFAAAARHTEAAAIRSLTAKNAERLFLNCQS